ARLVHLGVREGDAPVPAPVGGEADQTAAEPELVTVRLGYVDDLRVCDGSVSRLQLVVAAEILEQLTGDIGFARVVVSGEPLAVRRGVPRGLARLQVREDLARAAEEPTVLRLQNGNLIRLGN